MENIFSLMIFASGQVQGIVLQYKGRDHVRRDRDVLKQKIGEQVTITDDYGRELSLRPNGDEIVLVQDVDLAAEGNTIANVKNAVANQLAQVRAGKVADETPEIRTYKTNMRYTQAGQQRSAILS